jgi:hypothetical protein
VVEVGVERDVEVEEKEPARVVVAPALSVEKMIGENANLIVGFASKPEKKNLYIIVTGRVKMRIQIAPLFVP